ncbi:hypothetical protein P7K49_040487, partial [Saguinus oedipus]
MDLVMLRTCFGISAAAPTARTPASPHFCAITRDTFSPPLRPTPVGSPAPQRAQPAAPRIVPFIKTSPCTVSLKSCLCVHVGDSHLW